MYSSVGCILQIMCDSGAMFGGVIKKGFAIIYMLHHYVFVFT
jgi:hypothetical protein